MWIVTSLAAGAANYSFHGWGWGVVAGLATFVLIPKLAGPDYAKTARFVLWPF